MIPLVLGTLIAVLALGYVLFPLFFGAPRAAPAVSSAPQDDPDIAVVALREIEFDRATGKLSDVDYAALRERYTAQALEVMRRADAVAHTVDPVEAAVTAYRASHRACPGCGPRPEDDAVYCSNCGSYLAGHCHGCGSTVSQSGSRYCAECGRRLAA